MTDANSDREAVYLNTAGTEDLSRLGLGDEQARALVEARPFREWGDLKRIEHGVRGDVVTERRRRIGRTERGPVRRGGQRRQRRLPRRQHRPRLIGAAAALRCGRLSFRWPGRRP